MNRILITAIACTCATSIAHAQTYPAKTVRAVCAWPAGGLVDVVGRIVFQKISENTGQQFIVDNRAGGTGIIGAEIVARAPADGYTLLEMINVPYKGGNAGTTAAVSGETQLIAGTPAALAPHLNSNRLRLLAVTADTRLSQFPQTPTVAESGIPGYEYRGWVIVMAPANLPRPILERVHAEIIKSIDSADTKKRMEHLEPWTMTPEQTAARVRADYEKTGRLIAQVGARAE